MPDNRSFQFALLVSLVVHSVVFLGLPHMSFFPSKRSPEEMKITYYKIKEAPKEKETIAKKIEPVTEKLPEIKKEDILKPPSVVAEKPQQVKPEPRQTAYDKEIKEKKFEAVVKEEKDDAKRAAYISYYKAVRQKIKLYADRNYPKNRNMGSGEVFLSFVVTSSGELLQVRVVEERSVANRLLRDIAINSIRDASPFPPFPKGMGQYSITFNVIISFEK